MKNLIFRQVEGMIILTDKLFDKIL